MRSHWSHKTALPQRLLEKHLSSAIISVQAKVLLPVLLVLDLNLTQSKPAISCCVVPFARMDRNSSSNTCICVCLRLDIWITLYRFIFLHRRFMRCPFLLVRFTVHFFSEVSFFILFSVFLTLVFKARESPVSLRPHKNKGTLQMCVLQRSHRIDRRTFRIAPGIGSTVTVTPLLAIRRRQTWRKKRSMRGGIILGEIYYCDNQRVNHLPLSAEAKMASTACWLTRPSSMEAALPSPAPCKMSAKLCIWSLRHRSGIGSFENTCPSA